MIPIRTSHVTRAYFPPQIEEDTQRSCHLRVPLAAGQQVQVVAERSDGCVVVRVAQLDSWGLLPSAIVASGDDHRRAEEKSEIRRKLELYYMRFFPDKIRHLDSVMEAFEGRYEDLFDRLRIKFGRSPDDLTEDDIEEGKRLMQLRRILSELQETEEKYCRDMRAVLQRFRLLRGAEANGKTEASEAALLPSTMVAGIFANLGFVYAANSKMAAELSEGHPGKGVEELWVIAGSIMERWLPKLLHPYGEYCKGHAAAIGHLVEARNKFPDFKAVSGTLESELIKPVQRIPRYTLILEQAWRYLLDEKARDQVARAARVARGTSEMLNVRVKEEEERLRTADMFRRLGVPEGRGANTPGRLLLGEFRVTMAPDGGVRKPFTMFLLTGAVLFASTAKKAFGEGSLALRHSSVLRGVEVSVPGSFAGTVCDRPGFDITIVAPPRVSQGWSRTRIYSVWFDDSPERDKVARKLRQSSI